MANKTPEIGLYVEDIPMKLLDKCKPLDFSAYIEDETPIPQLFNEDYKFSAELYALEVFHFRHNERLKQLKDCMSRIDLKTSDHQINCDNNVANDLDQQLSVTQSATQSTPLSSLSSHIKQENDIKRRQQSVSSIHLNPGEILKPLLTKGSTVISDNRFNSNNNSIMSDNSIDSNVNTKRKAVKQINPKDFESDTSSPFDNVELQTIDDMQALNDVFQAFHSKSIQTKHSTHDVCINICNSNGISNDTNGINIYGAYGYEIPVNNSNCDQINPNNWIPFNANAKLNYGSHVCNDSNAVHVNESQFNNLRSSKSASDLPTLLSKEESIITKRERSHTPPCYSSKSKSKKHINGKQTLILNDPFEELSMDSKGFVTSISLMGFDRSRVARAVKHIDRDDKKVLDFLLQVQALEEDGYDCCESEIALHMNNYQIIKAKKFLESLRQLSEVGFDKEHIVKALVKCNNDRDKALDILLNDE